MTVIKHAWWCLQGFHQRLGKDYFATFALIAKFCSVRLIISLAVYHGWFLWHADGPQAFLTSTMPHDVYIRLARGLGLRDRRTGNNPVVDGIALRLLKAQHGLKQAPMLWNNDIS